jgi:hypothetical protein
MNIYKHNIVTTISKIFLKKIFFSLVILYFIIGKPLDL